MKFFSLISTAAAVTLLSASGFCDVQMTDLESRVSEMEKTQKTSVRDQISYSNNGSSSQTRMDDHERRLQNLEYQNGSSGQGQRAINALTSARGCPGQNGPYFDIEFLWLRAIEDHLDYGWAGTQTGDGNNGPDFVRAKAIEQDYEFDPGFRVGLGYNFDYDDWDLHAYYTWHYTYPKTSVSRSFADSGFVLGLFARVPVGDNDNNNVMLFQNAKSSWQSQFNAWDLDLGRNYYVGNHLALHPVAGLKGALIRQHLNVRYTNGNNEQTDNNGNVVGNISDVTTTGKSRYWGIGPKLGLFGSWELGAGFSINADVHGSLLYGEFTTRYTARYVDEINANDTFSLRVTDSLYRLRPMAYVNLGLEWGRCFWDWMHFNLHIGWEAQYWWQQMEFITFRDDTPDGDLSLTGLNVGFRFDF